MQRMDCSTLGTLVVNHEPIELIDVWSRKEFAAMHIRGARPLPFQFDNAARACDVMTNTAGCMSLRSALMA
jgi:rhodanese-related sulfurtransferase